MVCNVILDINMQLSLNHVSRGKHILPHYRGRGGKVVLKTGLSKGHPNSFSDICEGDKTCPQ